MQTHHKVHVSSDNAHITSDLSSSALPLSTSTYSQVNIKKEARQSPNSLENLSPALLYRLSIKFSHSNPQWTKKAVLLCWRDYTRKKVRKRLKRELHDREKLLKISATKSRMLHSSFAVLGSSLAIAFFVIIGYYNYLMIAPYFYAMSVSLSSNLRSRLFLSVVVFPSYFTHFCLIVSISICMLRVCVSVYHSVLSVFRTIVLRR
jgi:hypothetical protein